MLELVIRPRARGDLIGIWQYTLKEWGLLQADKYLQSIDREILGLPEFPDIGISYEHIRAGYRALHVEHHLVFYVLRKHRLEIIRVLHESMDAKRHL